MNLIWISKILYTCILLSINWASVDRCQFSRNAIFAYLLYSCFIYRHVQTVLLYQNILYIFPTVGLAFLYMYWNPYYQLLLFCFAFFLIIITENIDCIILIIIPIPKLVLKSHRFEQKKKHLIFTCANYNSNEKKSYFLRPVFVTKNQPFLLIYAHVWMCVHYRKFLALFISRNWKGHVWTKYFT